MFRSIKHSLLSLALLTGLSITGCAAQVDGVEETDEATEALSSVGKKLVGDFRYGAGQNFYVRISLASTGTYSASVKPCPINARCAEHPETGTWRTRGQNRLTISPAQGAETTYTLGLAGDGSGFKISRNGLTERLDRIPPENPCNLVDCPADRPVCEVQSGRAVCVAPTAAGKFCGGIAGIQCPANFFCVLDGTYPDAGGTCAPCRIPSCAPPPAGCRYNLGPVPAGTCRSSCGPLVCDGSTL